MHFPHLKCFWHLQTNVQQNSKLRFLRKVGGSGETLLGEEGLRVPFTSQVGGMHTPLESINHRNVEINAITSVECPTAVLCRPLGSVTAFDLWFDSVVDQSVTPKHEIVLHSNRHIVLLNVELHIAAQHRSSLRSSRHTAGGPF